VKRVKRKKALVKTEEVQAQDEDAFCVFLSEEPTDADIKESASLLAKLIYDVYKNPEENGIIINGQNKTYDEDNSN